MSSQKERARHGARDKCHRAWLSCWCSLCATTIWRPRNNLCQSHLWYKPCHAGPRHTYVQPGLLSVDENTSASSSRNRQRIRLRIDGRQQSFHPQPCKTICARNTPAALPSSAATQTFVRIGGSHRLPALIRASGEQTV